MVTVGGACAAAEDAVKAMASPPLGAAADNVTVQVEAAHLVEGVRICELQESPLTCTIFTVLPLAAMVKEFAAPSAATAFATCTAEAVFLVEFESVSDTQATLPFARGCAL
jgi:hypothetical protein